MSAKKDTQLVPIKNVLLARKDVMTALLLMSVELALKDGLTLAVREPAKNAIANVKNVDQKDVKIVVEVTSQTRLLECVKHVEQTVINVPHLLNVMFVLKASLKMKENA